MNIGPITVSKSVTRGKSANREHGYDDQASSSTKRGPSGTRLSLKVQASGRGWFGFLVVHRRVVLFGILVLVLARRKGVQHLSAVGVSVTGLFTGFQSRHFG